MPRADRPMFALDPLEHGGDALRLPGGQVLTVRFAMPSDAAALQAYFRGLSARSRYNRLMGAALELPQHQLDKFVHAGEDGSYSLLVTLADYGGEAIVAEARYAFEPQTGHVEFGLSVDDRWHRRGIGTALIGNLQGRAAAFGALRLFGDTLRSNEAMIALARKTGCAAGRTPGDWKQVRFEKLIVPAPLQGCCAGFRADAMR